MSERRRHDRKLAWIPVEISGTSALAVVRDVSPGGLSIGSGKRLEIGAELRVALVSPLDGARHTLEVTVVRVEPNAEDPEGLFPHVLGLRFGEEHPELDELAKMLADLREQAR